MVDNTFERLSTLGMAEYSDPPLTDQEKDALNLEGYGIRPVDQIQFQDVDEFMENINNFGNYFCDVLPGESPISLLVYRGRKAYQRFCVLFPELNTKLHKDMKGIGMGNRSGLSQDTAHDLFDAYQKMSKLVDINDYGVIEEPGDDPKNLFLGVGKPKG